MAKNKEISLLKMVEGIPVAQVWDSEVFSSGLRYQAVPEDVFIITYPKAGTTWMQVLVYALQTRGQAFDSDMNDFRARTPWLESVGAEGIHKMLRPGSVKTHFSMDRLNMNPQAKYICVVRNPKDSFISYHQFCKTLPFFEENTDMTVNLELWINGMVPCGSYFDHLRSVWTRRNDPNVLFLLYEDMLADLPSVIRKVAHFLQIELDDALLARVEQYSSFKYMKDKFDHEWRNYHAKPIGTESSALSNTGVQDFFSQQLGGGGPTISYVNEGRLNGWKSLLSKEQSLRLHARFMEEFKDHDELQNLWNKWNVFD